MTGFGGRATVIAGRVVVAVCAVLLVGCGSASDDGAGSAANGPSQTAPDTEAASSGGSDAAEGNCVELSGTEENANVEVVDCGSDQAAFIVAAAVGGSDECPGDVDSTYYEELMTVETSALCLDVNWRPETCYDLTDSTGGATIAPCAAAPGRQIVRFEQRIDGATDVNGCATEGYVYSERSFVICASTVE